MKRYHFIIFFILIISLAKSKPIYNEKQLRSLLYNHSKITKEFPTILGIHFYNNKEAKPVLLQRKLLKMLWLLVQKNKLQSLC